MGRLLLTDYKSTHGQVIWLYVTASNISVLQQQRKIRALTTLISYGFSLTDCRSSAEVNIIERCGLDSYSHKLRHKRQFTGLVKCI